MTCVKIVITTAVTVKSPLGSNVSKVVFYIRFS